tara:strand:- start:834 stop:1730 length:897 start_codon:yes stop_codon:yes gene_type:complete
MTFDGREGAHRARGSNALFAVTTLAVVGGAFFLVLNFPGKSKPGAAGRDAETMVAAAAMRPASLPASLTSKTAKAYFATLARVDPGASAGLQKRLAKASGRPQAEQAAIIFDHAAGLLKVHAADLARADTRHVDAILTMTRDRLKSASHAGNTWCQGRQYAGLDPSALGNKAALNRELEMLEEPLRDYGFELMTHLLVAIEDAGTNPVARGALTQTDKAAMQGVVMSMVSDPQVMPLLMAAQTGTDSGALVASLNVCDLGATAVSAIKTLPQDTKGRAFADLVHQMELGGDLGGLPQF